MDAFSEGQILQVHIKVQWPYKQKSNEFRSDEREGQATGFSL